MLEFQCISRGENNGCVWVNEWCMIAGTRTVWIHVEHVSCAGKGKVNNGRLCGLWGEMKWKTYPTAIDDNNLFSKIHTSLTNANPPDTNTKDYTAYDRQSDLNKKNHFFSLVKSIQFHFLSMIDERFIIGVIYSPTALEKRRTSFIYHNKLHELFSIFFCEETKRQKTIVSPLRLTAVYSLIFLCLFLFRCRFVAHLLIEFDRTEQTQ